MDAYWLTIYLALMGLVIVQSLLLALQTWEHRRYVRSCMRDVEHHQPNGRVALFAPCKGIDLEFETNIRALMEQDYDDYEITFIVESTEDPAWAAIRRTMAAHPWVPTKVIVAGKATEGGQKVHNLRVAMEHLSPRIKYLAFVDSDARPRPEWLRMMVARLDEPGWGAVTGYRWFTPARASVPNALVYSMNCDILSLLSRSSHYLIWGGSWAIRRDLFEQIGLREAWKGTLSDDLVASRLMRRAKLPVRFEPASVVASPLNESLGSALSFIRRQYLIARLYTFDWWLFSFVAATFTSLTWLGNLGFLAWSLLGGGPSPWIPLSICGALYLISVYRGWLRQDLVKTYFPHWECASRPIQRFDIWANPLVELVHWVGVASAAFGKQVDWRGIRYHVLPGGKVEAILRRDLPCRQMEEESLRYRLAG